MTWKRIATLGWATLAVSMLAACGKPSDGKTHVEFWTLSLKPTFTAYVEETLAGFERAHPDVKVDWIDVPGSAIAEKTLAAVSSGKPPDLVNLNPDFSERLAARGALLTLDDRWTPQERSAFFPSAIEAVTVRGHVIALPWYLSTQVCVYDRTLLERTGEQALPRTYPALLEAFSKLSSPSVHAFLPHFGDSLHLLELMALDGIPLLDGSGKKAAFDTPDGRKTFGFWVKAFRDRKVPLEALSLDHREVIDRFQAGQSAVLPTGPQFLKMVQTNAPALYERLEVAPQVEGRSGRVGMALMELTIPGKARHPEQALALARYITSAERQLAFCKLATIMPSIRSAARDPYFTTLGASASLDDRARQISARQLERAHCLVPPLPHLDRLKKALGDAFQQAVLGKQDPDAALAAAAAEWNRILATP
jgi:putative chitobiose transport system substrate-binding protein